MNLKLLFISLVKFRMNRSTGGTATSGCGSFLTWLCFKYGKWLKQPGKPPEASARVQVGSSCSALGWLLCLGNKPPARSLPSGLLVFAVLEPELYPVPPQTSASCSPGPDGRCSSTCTDSSGLEAPQQQAQGSIRRQSCPHDHLCLSPGSLFSVSKAEHFRELWGSSLGWGCGGKHMLLVPIRFLSQA